MPAAHNAGMGDAPDELLDSVCAHDLKVMPQRRVHRFLEKMPTFMLGEEEEMLRAHAEGSVTGRAAKTLIAQGPLRIALLALRRGTSFSLYQSDGPVSPVSIQTLRGCVRVTTDVQDVELPAGNLIALASGLSHTVTALVDCAILLTVAMP